MRGRRLNGWSRIGNFLNWWALVRTNADWLPDSDIWIAILALFMCASGRETTSSKRCINLPIFWTWKESEADQSLMDFRTGCYDVRTDASWNRSFSIQWRVWTERHVVRMDDAGLFGVRTGWHVIRTDGTVDRWAFGRDDTSSGRLIGNLNSSIVQSLLKMHWQVESLFTAGLHISDFVQTQNEAKILTNSPFGHSGTKITWPVWKYIPVQKIKITPPFCHKGTKGKPE
jgi:hypothetical protein